MKQNQNKDKWIQETLESADNIKRAEASPFIYPKILNRLKDLHKTGSIIPLRRAAIGFVSIILLAIINVFVIFGSADQPDSDKNKVTKTESSSQFIPSQYNPYLEILNKN